MADPVDTSEQTKAAVERLAAAYQNGTTPVEKFSSVIDELTTILQQHEGVVLEVAKAQSALTAVNLIFDSKPYELLFEGMEKAARVPKILASELAGGNVFLTEQTNKQARIIQDDAYKTQQELIEKTISLGVVNGKEIIRPLTVFYKDAEEMGRSFYETVLADSRLYNAGVMSLNSDNAFQIKELTDLTMKGLQVRAETLRAIYQEEFSKTGEITGEFIEKFSSTVLAAEKITGLSNRALSEDLQRMITDVTMFGNQSYAQLASLSSTIHQLGLDIDDVAHVSTKFMSFEDASTSIANIAAVTGGTLDTLKLFYLANEDKEGFFRELRSELLDTGVSYEQLSHQEQVYLTKQLGLTSPRQLQSLLEAKIDASTNITDLIEKAAKSDEFQGEALIDKIAKTGGMAQQALESIQPDKLQAALSAIKDLAGGTAAFSDSLVAFSNDLESAANDTMPKMAAAGKEAGSAFGIALKYSSTALSEFDGAIDTFIKGGGIEKLVASLKSSALYPRSLPPVWKDIISGVDLFAESWSSSLTSLNDETVTKISQITKTTQSLESSLLKSTETIEKLKIKGTIDQSSIELPTQISNIENVKDTTQLVSNVSGIVRATLDENSNESEKVSDKSITQEENKKEKQQELTTSDMKVNIKLNIDTEELHKLITASVTEVIKGTILINTPTGKNPPGFYKIALEQA